MPNTPYQHIVLDYYVERLRQLVGVREVHGHHDFVIHWLSPSYVRHRLSFADIVFFASGWRV